MTNPAETVQSRRDFVAVVREHLDELGEDAAVEMCIRNLGSMTHAEIGILLGMSKQAVEQAEKRMFPRIRRRMNLLGVRSVRHIAKTETPLWQHYCGRKIRMQDNNDNLIYGIAVVPLYPGKI